MHHAAWLFMALLFLAQTIHAALAINFHETNLGGNSVEWLNANAEIQIDFAPVGRLNANSIFVGGSPPYVGCVWDECGEDPLETGLTFEEWVDTGVALFAHNIRIELNCPSGTVQYYVKDRHYPMCGGMWEPVYWGSSMPAFSPCDGCQSLSPAEHDFGVVTQPGPQTTTFTIRNEGEACAPISGLVFTQYPDSLFTVEPTSYELPPGGAQEFMVTYLGDNRGEVVRDIYTTHGRFTCRVDDRTSSGVDSPGSPADFGLCAFPNPFNPSTTLAFHLPKPGEVRLDLYDARGAHVNKLLREWRAAGDHHVMLATDGWPTGLYLCVLESEGRRQANKLLLVR